MSDTWSQRRRDKTNRARSNRAAFKADREVIKAASAFRDCDCSCHQAHFGEPNPHHGQPCLCKAVRRARSAR